MIDAVHMPAFCDHSCSPERGVSEQCLSAQVGCLATKPVYRARQRTAGCTVAATVKCSLRPELWTFGNSLVSSAAVWVSNLCTSIACSKDIKHVRWASRAQL